MPASAWAAYIVFELFGCLVSHRGLKPESRALYLS